MKNHISLIGRVGKDPETKQLTNGVVSNFSLATSEKYKDKQGQKQEQTEWHNITAWGKTAETVDKYVKKGDMIGVEGKMTYQKWEDKDGNNRTTPVVKMDMYGGLIMLGSNQTQDTTNTQADNDDPFA